MDLATALGALAERGYARVLAEGGPTLNGQLAAAGLLDELCLTVSPLLAGGGAKRNLAGPAPPSGSGWQIRSLCEQDGFLFLRYRRNSRQRAETAGRATSQHRPLRYAVTRRNQSSRRRGTG